MTIYDFLPKFIKRLIADKPRQTITNEYWNELFNLLIEQGDHGQEAIQIIADQLANNVLLKDNETPWTPTNDFQPATVKFVTDWVVALGSGDMIKANYDSNNDGVVNDSDRLGGQLPSAFALAAHAHADKADLVAGKVPVAQLPEVVTIPTSHASSATTYGVGSTAAYGHCKTIDNLTRAAYASGESLSAYQGYLLKGLIDGKAPTVHAHNYAGSATAGGDATNALKINGNSIWIGAESSKGTDANTIYFCS